MSTAEAPSSDDLPPSPEPAAPDRSPEALDRYLALIEDEREARPAEAWLADEIRRLRLQLDEFICDEGERGIRSDERTRLAALFLKHKATLEQIGDGQGLPVELVAALIDLGTV